jgi:hypothetical protein
LEIGHHHRLDLDLKGELPLAGRGQNEIGVIMGLLVDDAAPSVEDVAASLRGGKGLQFVLMSRE